MICYDETGSNLGILLGFIWCVMYTKMSFLSRFKRPRLKLIPGKRPRLRNKLSVDA
jgi:hypothetical protein